MILSCSYNFVFVNVIHVYHEQASSRWNLISYITNIICISIEMYLLWMHICCYRYPISSNSNSHLQTFFKTVITITWHSNQCPKQLELLTSMFPDEFYLLVYCILIIFVVKIKKYNICFDSSCHFKLIFILIEIKKKYLLLIVINIKIFNLPYYQQNFKFSYRRIYWL